MTIYSVEMQAQGMNLTGLEQTWTESKLPDIKSFRQKIRRLALTNHDYIRIPIDFHYYLHEVSVKDKIKFKRILIKILDFAHKQNIKVVIANFQHGLVQDNYENASLQIGLDCKMLLYITENSRIKSEDLYLEIVNEPVIYPEPWRIAASIIIEEIQKDFPEQNILVGASNYNSIYELSRMQPLPFDNLIYTFHFYEPFVFTHQGTAWTGVQNATTGIPFPVRDSITKLPDIHPNAIGTAGEENLKSYFQIGSEEAIIDKLKIVANWRDENNVTLWCTEYGVTENADKISRENYLRIVSAELTELNIPGFIWEYIGNFGVEKLDYK